MLFLYIKKAFTCKRRKHERSYTTCYNIPLYAFPLTVENRQNLLDFSFSLKLRSDLPCTVLLPGSHHPRLSEQFPYTFTVFVKAVIAN